VPANAVAILIRSIVANTHRLGLFVVLGILAATSLLAQTVDLAPGERRESLVSDVRYVLRKGAPSETWANVLSLPVSAYDKIDSRYIDFGYTTDTIWLRLELRNVGDETGHWRLRLNVRFMTALLVYLGGRTDSVLLNQNERSTFDTRPIRHRVLTVPFSLEAGERSVLLIGYQSRGTTAMPISIETPQSDGARSVREDSIDFAAYAVVAFMIALTLMQSAVFRQSRELHYALYIGATLIYIVHVDGFTFQYLWPEQPHWNSYAAVPLGLVMSMAALNFARRFTDAPHIAPAYDKLMLAAGASAALLCFGGLVISEALVKKLAFAIASATAALCLGAGVIALLRRRPGVRFFVIGWVGVLGGVLLTSIVNTFPALVTRSVELAIPKLTIIFDTLMFYMALADQGHVIRVERDAALRREVAALREQHVLTQQLHNAETERLEAMLAAEARSRRLATASHDIRQPLASLRLTIERLAQAANLETMAAGLRQSLDYLDRLTDEYSAEADDDLGAPVRIDGEADTFDLEALIGNVDLMFREEAEAKGLTFRSRACSVRVRGDAMATMRIVSNLVANAIKYTSEGKILVGCRRTRQGVTIVVADTGPGMEADELERVLESRERGSTTKDGEGHGLGLGIAGTLASELGYGFRCRSTPGRGTAFFVDVPASHQLESDP
jgi:signal transduction histidine kinase